jgi:hypothetical protein
MSKKKDNVQKEIGAVNTLRIYDSALIDRLNKRFNDSGNRYEHRNHFLTDLIETGLNRKQHEISFKNNLLANETETYKSIYALAERHEEFEKYIRTQFQTLRFSDYLLTAILTATYNITEAAALRKIVSQNAINGGCYDDLPERFQKLKTTVERVFVKDE